MHQRHSSVASMRPITIHNDKDKMHLSSNVRMLCSRFHTMLRQRKRKQQKRSLEISAPFNLVCEPVSLPGISEDEIAILREKAAASRIGVAELRPVPLHGLNAHPPMRVSSLSPRSLSSSHSMI